MAVIGALLVVMVVTVLVSGFMQRQSASVRTMENALLRTQGRLALQGALDWARLVLRSDARRWPTTRPDQLWAVPVEDTRITHPDTGRVAVFSGAIEDEQGKFNLTNLTQHGVAQPQALDACERLMNMLGLPAALTATLTQRIAWAQVQTGPEGAITGPARAPLPESLDDLLTLDSVTLDVINILRRHVTILPQPTAVNVNTASPEVLAATISGLGLARARALVARRDRGLWFNNSADFINQLGDPALKVHANQFVVNSSWFLVKGAVTLDNSILATRALLHRDSTGQSRVAWIREFH